MKKRILNDTVGSVGHDLVRCFLMLPIMCLLSTTLFGQTLAFPGAVGFGAYATGGRAGTVYHVTNLNDSGAGSFRDAVSSGNRIIVFDVGGYINLASAISMHSDITVAGQTAPGDGIGIMGREVSFDARHNIIFRHFRFRQGTLDPDSGKSGINLLNATNVILDHVSIEFAQYDNIDAVGCSDITIMNSINADPIGQQFCAHMEHLSANCAWYNTIFADVHNRAPLDKINAVYINNVVYNYQAGYTVANTSGHFSHDIVNNYFIAGPATGSPGNDFYQMNTNQSIYSSGNLLDSDKNGSLGGSSTTPGGVIHLSSPWSSWTTTIPTLDTVSALKRDVSLSGALPHDQVDMYVIGNVQSYGTGGPYPLPTSQTVDGLGNNGYGVINGGTAAVDTDGDGMPDYWETAMGLNPNDASDGGTINPDGYSNLEHYLNWLADLHAATPVGTAVDIDLSQYTGGFSASSTYAVTAPVNGTVSMINSTTAEFVPATGFAGLGSFQFTVNDGSAMTDTINVLVTGTGIVNTNPPAAPAGLSATGGNAKVTLSWTASAGATSYNVKRATVSGGPYTTLASATTTGYTDTTAANATTYYYVVSAVNSYGESGDSSEVSATPGQPYYQVNSGGPALSPYAADAWFSGGSTFTNTDIVNTNNVLDPAPMAAYQTERKGDFSYTFPSLIAGANYRVRLHFAEIYFNSSGQREFNVSINGVQVLTNFDIFAVAGKDVAIVKEFIVPADASGQITVQYTTVINNAKSSAIEIYGAYSNTNQPPNAPTALTAMGGNLVVNLNWTQSTSPGITGNNVYRSTTGSGGPYNLLANLAATAAYSDTAVNAGSTYFYSVTAVNANGESALSAYSGATTVPPAPAGLTATAGNNQVALSWTASPGASSYNVKRATVSGGPYTTIASPTTTGYTDTTAVNGTTYYYVVSAVNGSGESANSTEVSATPSAPTAPAAPTSLTATAGHKKVTLNWTQSTSPNIVSNKVYRATVSGGPYTLVTTLAATTTYANTGLTSGTTYYYVVTAVNSSNLESPYSNQASATPR